MTPQLSRKPRTVTLTRTQVAQIIHDMGWEEEDADTFWHTARCESRAPGFVRKRIDRYWQRVHEGDDRYHAEQQEP